MATTPLHPAAEAAREAHRDHLGRFGAQPATESECSLAPSRDDSRAAATTLLHDFDPAVPGTSGRSVTDLLAVHSELTRAASPAASTTDRARGLATSVRACGDGAGGLDEGCTTILARACVDGSTDLADPFVATHTRASRHVRDVLAGRSRPGDHPDDSTVLGGYRADLGLRRPAPADTTGTASELALAWSWQLDVDALQVARAAEVRRFAPRHTSAP